MPPGRGGKWHKEAASVPYWFGKSIRRAHFLPVYLRVCHSVGSFEKVPTGCRGAREPWRSGTLRDDAVGKGGDAAEGHLRGGTLSLCLQGEGCLGHGKLHAWRCWWRRYGEGGRTMEREGLEIQGWQTKVSWAAQNWLCEEAAHGVPVWKYRGEKKSAWVFLCFYSLLLGNGCWCKEVAWSRLRVDKAGYTQKAIFNWLVVLMMKSNFQTKIL